MKGKFIALYGINNIGKSTHAKKLVKRLNDEGVKANYVKYPVYNIEPTGSFLNKILRGGKAQEISEQELQMWFTLNRFQYQPTLKRMLDAGEWVVAEDYVGTGLAWGASKGCEIEWLKRMNQDLLTEDLAILMDGQRQTSAREINHIHESNDDLVAKCQQIHRQLRDQYQWPVVEIQDNREDTADLIWAEVAKFRKKILF